MKEISGAAYNKMRSEKQEKEKAASVDAEDWTQDLLNKKQEV